MRTLRAKGEAGEKESFISYPLSNVFLRHGRACPGHPLLPLLLVCEDVDARHKAGHDELSG
jgi:hypothetical protein